MSIKLFWWFSMGQCNWSKAERSTSKFRDVQNFCHTLSQCNFNPRSRSLDTCIASCHTHWHKKKQSLNLHLQLSPSTVLTTYLLKLIIQHHINRDLFSKPFIWYPENFESCWNFLGGSSVENIWRILPYLYIRKIISWRYLHYYICRYPRITSHLSVYINPPDSHSNASVVLLPLVASCESLSETWWASLLRTLAAQEVAV